MKANGSRYCPRIEVEMRNFLIALLIFVVWSVLALGIYSLVKYNETEQFMADIQNVFSLETEEKNETEMIAEEITQTSEIEEEKPAPVKYDVGLQAVGMDGSLIFDYEEGIEIYKNSEKISVPKSVDSFSFHLKNYITLNPDTELHIISSYGPDENIERPNFGAQRGNEIKKLLKSNDIAENKIVVTPFIKDIRFDSLGRHSSGIRFIVQPFNEKRAANENKFPDKITVYPEFAQSGIKVNDNLLAALDVVTEELKNSPTTKIKVIGHTDNVGNASDNFAMGLTYAREVRWYLVSKAGVPASQVSAISKGESEPIDTNNTTRGRKLNRRIEIVFYNE